jgi:hypothetical protein
LAFKIFRFGFGFIGKKKINGREKKIWIYTAHVLLNSREKKKRFSKKKGEEEKMKLIHGCEWLIFQRGWITNFGKN